jgi:ABC-type branched-subunit amino acid transport system substrate-binding protein
MKREWDAQAQGAQKDATWIVPIAYASDFIQRLGSAKQAEGIIGHNLYSMFFSNEDAKNIPEVALFQQWMKRVHPGAALELYAMYSWAAAKLLVQVMKSVGPKLTRKAFLDAIKQVHEFDGGGIVNQSDIGNHKPSNCYVLWAIRNGNYVREDTPPDKYRCDGTFVPYSG